MRDATKNDGGDVGALEGNSQGADWEPVMTPAFRRGSVGPRGGRIMSEQRLFISHASEDAAVVGRIVEYLEQRGIPCWVSGRDIPPRAIYAEAITSGMQACTACAVIISEAANASAGVKRELELASHSGKPFIPIRVDGVEPGPGLDYYLRNTQWIEFHSERERALDRIVAHMKGAPPAAAPPRRAPAPKRGNPLPIVLGALALVLAIGAGVYFYNQYQQQTDYAAVEELAPVEEAEPVAPETVDVDGLWNISVLCANGAAMREPNVSFSEGQYARTFSGAAEGETQLFIESTDANSIHVTGQVAFTGGAVYPLNASATSDENGVEFSGVADYGANAGCPFTASRLEG